MAGARGQRGWCQSWVGFQRGARDRQSSGTRQGTARPQASSADEWLSRQVALRGRGSGLPLSISPVSSRPGLLLSSAEWAHALLHHHRGQALSFGQFPRFKLLSPTHPIFLIILRGWPHGGHSQCLGVSKGGARRVTWTNYWCRDRSKVGRATPGSWGSHWSSEPPWRKSGVLCIWGTEESKVPPQCSCF